MKVDETARPGIDLGHAVDVFNRLLAPLTADVPSADEYRSMLELDPAGQPETVAQFTRNLGIRHRDWLFLHDERERLRAAGAGFFESFDVLLSPVLAVAATPHDLAEPMRLRQVEVNGEARPYVEQVAWMGLIGAVHLQATVAPVGRTAENLPVGIQIVAPYLEDRTSIEFAHLLADRIGGYERPPGFDSPIRRG